jgi:predicted O-methyltransferase YrrM
MLQQDRTPVEIQDFGAGSSFGQKKRRTVGEIAKNMAKSPKIGRLLFRVAHHYKPESIVELGTSLGISASYLSLGAKDASLVTIEGAPTLAELAATNLKELAAHNASVLTGSFDVELPLLLEKHHNIGMAFIDGNHRMEPTLHYFNLLLERMAPSSVIIFDDIHWSREMEICWSKIKSDPRVMLTIDLFFLGMVFIRNEFRIKQDFVIRF